MFETFERRRFFSVVSGTSEDDVFVVTESKAYPGYVAVAGSPYYINEPDEELVLFMDWGNDSVSVDLPGEFMLAHPKFRLVVYGSGGDDTITGSTAGDFIDGGGGDDVINGWSGNDRIDGSYGNDTLIGGNGRDSLYGGSENDSLRGNGSADVLYGDDGNDTIYGDSGSDHINGGANPDRLRGGDGDDDIAGGGGRDLIGGEAGNDTLNGQAGPDALAGGVGSDSFLHVETIDTTDYTAGQDSGSGAIASVAQLDLHNNKLFVTAPGAGATSTYNGVTGLIQTVSGALNGSGIVTSGTPTAGSGSLTTIAVAMESSISNSGNTFGGQTITGGDTLVMYTWNGDADLDGKVDADDYFQIDGAYYNAFANYDVQGTSKADRILVYLQDGELVVSVNTHLSYPTSHRPIQIDAGDGDDVVWIDPQLGAKSVTIRGGAGADTILAGGGNDRIFAGDGDDSVEGGDGKDTIYGDAGNDSLRGGGGSDLLDGGDGADTLRGDAGNDNICGGANSDRLRGSAGNDTLDGGGSRDLIAGEIGDDSLIGGAGDDVCDGGAGTDDFNGGSGFDQIFLSHSDLDYCDIEEINSGETSDADAIVQAAGLVKTGAGKLNLNGAHTRYSGATTVQGGTLTLSPG